MSDATQNWEYTTLKVVAKDWFLAGTLDQTLFDSRLNQLGKDGWELVSVFDTSVVKEATGEIVAVLKRPRRNQPHDTQLYLKTLLPDYEP
ncbi:MAG: DUF4177 domain-containing protein [Planctomycetia bacterium]|nr:DUF4177 domain-containing protein [Planctomycetia bacterium]